MRNFKLLFFLSFCFVVFLDFVSLPKVAMAAGNFRLFASPISQHIVPGGATSYTITVICTDVSGPIQLYQVSVSPYDSETPTDQVTTSLSSTSLSCNGSVVLTAQAKASATPYDYSVIAYGRFNSAVPSTSYVKTSLYIDGVPPAPTNLTLDNSVCGQITLNWSFTSYNPWTAQTGFNIYMTADLAFPVSLIGQAGPADRTFTYTPSANGSLHYTVTAYNDAGESGRAFVSGAMTSCPTPTQPPGGSSTPTPTPTPTNQPPTASNVTATELDYCFGVPINISWNYSDPEGDAQGAYQVQIDTFGSSFGSPDFDTGKVLSTSTSAALTGLAFNTTYQARVKVWDANDNESDWSVQSACAGSGCLPSQLAWKTPIHAYPSVNFSWTPDVPLDKQSVQFTDLTVFASGEGSWNWNFGDNGSSLLQNPTHIYSTENIYNVTLTATDEVGQSCSLSKMITVSPNNKIPVWKEVEQ
jgi:hypothetical protein